MLSNDNTSSEQSTLSKELATGVTTSVSKVFRGNRFLNRNMKPLIAYALIFLAISLACHFSLRSAQESSRQEIFNAGILSANTMGEKINAPLLEKDILTLNVAIGELEKKHQPVFAAILDHYENIIAHSSPVEIGRKFKSPEGQKEIGRVQDVTILRIHSDSTSVISFSKDLFFSKVNIGRLVFGVDATGLDKTIARYDMFVIITWVMCIILFVAAVFFTDNHLKKKRQRELEEIEKTMKVGPYNLTRKIAQGGMAELYLAEYEKEDGFKRIVAIKKILPHLVENQDFVDMFIREARLAAILQHPNIVQIYDLIKLHNANFMAMEYVPGKNLAEILAHEKKGLGVGMATFIIQKISLGLYFSHTRTNDETGEPLNIVHRDVSPQNMLVSFKGEVKISDFGISKARSEPSFTQAGVIKGKLSYLSPEQALGKETDHLSDLYALGIIFYEILSGKRLYKFGNELEALSSLPKKVITPIIKIRKEIPEKLSDIVMKCLEKDPAIRYQSGKEIYDDLADLRRYYNITFDETDLIDFMAERFK